MLSKHFGITMDEIDDTISLSPLGSQIGLPSEHSADTISGVSACEPSRGGDSVLPRTHAINVQLEDCVRLCIFNTKRTLVDEAWRELHSILPWSTYRDIVKLQRVTFANSPPRIDMWVRGDLGASLVRHLREMTRERTPSFIRSLKASGASKNYRSVATSGWRMAIWRSWRDRHDAVERPVRKNDELAKPLGCRLATLNVNGFPSKRAQVAEFLREERITVVTLQETLVSAAQYPVHIPGFNTFARPWQEGFRGLAILVDNRFSAYEVPHERERVEGYQYLLHVKVSGISGLLQPLHFVGVYLPSGGSMRSARTSGLRAITHLSDEVLRNEHGATFVAMGDLNCGFARIDKFLASREDSLLRNPTRGSPWTRFPAKGIPASLDHMLVSPRAASSFVKPRVSRQWAMSDHRPLISALRVHNPAKCGTPWTPVRYDRRRLATHSFELVNDNRWLPLAGLEVDSAAKLSDAALHLSSTLKDVTVAAGIRVDSGPEPSWYMPNRLKRLLKKYRGFSARVADCLADRERFPDGPSQDLQRKYEAARRTFRMERKTWERREKQQHYARIAEDFLVHDHKNVWSRLKSQIDTRHRGTSSQPVRNKAGVLCVEEDAILTATAEHYCALAQDDPGGISRDAARWTSITPEYPRQEDELEDLNESLSWPEVLLAIRGMNRDTAPGKDEMHTNLLKALVSEECQMAVFGGDKGKRPDLVRVALPESDLPSTPLTAMGKALWNVLKSVWTLEEIPDLWNEVHVVSLLKKGDPELLVNYRGVSLISVSLKVLLLVMVHRLEKHVSNGTISISQAQSGFRKREEAIAQFIAVAEIVRRRHLLDLPTVGIFVDFKKAYDRVSHEGLYRILDHRGVRGKFLNVIKAMYRNSQMSVRACGKLSDPFDMRRGARQGCPLSPLLFIIFIDHILAETNPKDTDLKVPVSLKRAAMNGTVLGEKPIEVSGGLYADDLVCLENSLVHARRRCERLVEWGEKWGMELNFGKCGIMLWSYDEALRREYDEMDFATAHGTFPKVSSYKYLGIDVDENLQVFMGSDPRSTVRDGHTTTYQHAKERADKGLKTLGVLKPVLCDRFCPLPLKVELVRSFVLSVMTYGGEFIGFNKKNVAPIQRVMDLATRWIMGFRKSNKRVAGLTLSVEMGLPMVYEYMAGMRARLYHKLKFGSPPMQTYLRSLQGEHRFHPKRTWCSENELWLKAVHSSNLRQEGTLAVEGGVNKYAPIILSGSELVRLQFNDPISGEFDDKAYDEMVDEVTTWWLLGERGDSPWGPKGLTLENFTPVRTDGSAPIRSWFAFARICELHRRSNAYQSTLLRDHRRLLLGIDELGRVVLDPRILPDPIVREEMAALRYSFSEEEARNYADAFYSGYPMFDVDDLQRERDLQDTFIGGAKSDDGARCFVREVRECALERLMDVDGGRFATFTDWYDKFQFGATRDFLRISLGRPDLIEGVRWLVMVRVGGFPRSDSFRRRRDPTIDHEACPLCEGRVEAGWDWAHLAMSCSHEAVVAARGNYLEPALEHLLRQERVDYFYQRWPDTPKVLQGLPYQHMSDGRIPGILAMASAIYLAGGCLTDPREATFTFSFGQCDMLTSGLEHFGYVYLASFLQTVAPYYSVALGHGGTSGVDAGESVSSSNGDSDTATALAAQLTEEGQDNIGVPVPAGTSASIPH